MIKKVVISLIISFMLFTSVAFAFDEYHMEIIGRVPYGKYVNTSSKTVGGYYVKKDVDHINLAYRKDLFKGKINILGEEYDNIIIFYQQGAAFYIEDLGEEINYLINEDIRNGHTMGFWEKLNVKDHMEYLLASRALKSGIHIISINGEPWQHTKYKDMFMEELKNQYQHYLDDPTYLELIKNPMYNGLIEEYRYDPDRVGIYFGKDTIDVHKFVVEGDLKHRTFKNTVTKKKMPTNINSIGGVGMVPLRGVLEELGAKIHYNSETKEIIFFDKGQTVKIKSGSDIANVNGVDVKMPRRVEVQNGTTLIPIKFIGENLKHEVFWVEKEKKIIISKPSF